MFTPMKLVLLITSTLAIDPECYMTVPEITRHFGYPSEVHLVRTQDDYILELHRIPHGRNQFRSSDRPVVFLQHGIFADGFNWTPNLANQSAAFVFADAGFDVWIANSRGTPPSQKHIGYGPDDVRFWNFTWQDISAYDLSSSIDYVLQKTGHNDLYYIGHSQGTMVMFAKLAEDPSFGRKIRHFHALAPVATVSHIGGLFHIFGNYLMDFADFVLHRIPNSPLALPKILQKIMGFFCSLPLAQGVCTLDIGFIDGSEKMFNNTRVGVYLCHTPAATSSKNLLHWVQVVKSRKVEKFDYGEEGNMKEYGMKTPPIYDLRNIKTPTFLYWSKDDILADTEDIRETILASMNETIRGNYELPHYTHLDFVFGINATTDLYRPIIEEIRRDANTRMMLLDNRVHT
ncbi:hypothetical protein Y032_0116g533 [Ancylostoma ceylanicum]|uniref:Lipase n=2 Tax=Ancylostoma ceylanicum TaxID=53326 RepID=A0A016TCB3_9BILA|nr:hypothetical protein Y032_0116g533 [Ancylostoma ceylanicum]